MNIGKIFTLLCAMILSVCLVFAISSLTVLRNAVAETDRVKAGEIIKGRMEKWIGRIWK